MTQNMLMENFVKACQELQKNQISFYCFVGSGGTDLSNFHPDVKMNNHIGAYYKAKEDLEASTGQQYTVLPELKS